MVCTCTSLLSQRVTVQQVGYKALVSSEDMLLPNRDVVH